MEKLKPEKIEMMLGIFNFSGVQSVMTSMNWGWGLDNKIPSIEELIITARELLNDVNETEEEIVVSTGGLEAINDGSGIITLQFVAERVTNYGKE